MAITFPANPVTGDEFLADNGTTYIWLGDRWSGIHAVLTGTAQPVFDGEYSSSVSDNTLEGGVEHIIGAN